MRRSDTETNAMPAFRSAAEKRAWLLAQLAAVEREALYEEMAAGRNERITIRAGDTLRIDVGGTVLYEGADAAEFSAVLAKMVNALPLGSTFMVEAGKGGKTLSGGSAADAEPPLEQPVPTPKRRPRQPRSDGSET